MVPIHDTDVAEERWSKGEWSNYELWEKVEIRLRRNRRVWIAATVILFLALSAVPIVMDRWPKWASRSLARQLALEINRVKKEAAVSRSPFKFVITDLERLEFAVGPVISCANSLPLVGPAQVRTGVLSGGKWGGSFFLLNHDQGGKLGIPGLVTEYCYDPFQGSSAESKEVDTVGFGIISVKDLTENRLDRLTVLLLSGPSADISFD
ncbi:MAG: hypothetical protein HYX41_03690 [Bdellovibrio sp.]|nr:hypothetical protein [Bdellovibrio sp.]